MLGWLRRVRPDWIFPNPSSSLIAKRPNSAPISFAYTACLPEFEREADRVGELHEMGADVYLYLPSPQPNHP